MSQSTLDSSLPPELHAPAVDIHESSFSRSQEASPNGSSLELPMFEFDYSLRTELHPCAVDVLESSLFRAREASPENPSPESPTPKQVREYTGNENHGSVALTDLGLFVKWGREHLVRIEEAQSLQAIWQAFSNNEVPAPELVAWRSENIINYLYMSLVPGLQEGL